MTEWEFEVGETFVCDGYNYTVIDHLISDHTGDLIYNFRLDETRPGGEQRITMLKEKELAENSIEPEEYEGFEGDMATEPVQISAKDPE